MIRKARSHCRRNPQRLVYPSKIVVHEVNRNHRGMILDFLGEPLVRRVKRRIPIRIVRFWRSTKLVLTCFGSGSPLTTLDRIRCKRRENSACPALRCAINLLKLRIVHIGAKSILPRVQIDPVTVRCDLDSTLYARGAIVHKLTCPAAVTTSQQDS